MFKLFIYALFLYVLYRLLTGWGKKKNSAGVSGQGDGAGPAAIADELVEDPVCHIYIPKRQAVVLNMKSGPVHFCSERCRESYLEAQEKH